MKGGKQTKGGRALQSLKSFQGASVGVAKGAPAVVDIDDDAIANDSTIDSRT